MAMQVVVAAVCIGGAAGCGSESERRVRPVPAPRSTPPSAQEPAPSDPEAASLLVLDDGAPFALHRRPDGTWEVGVYQVEAEARRVHLRPVGDESLGAPRLETSYAVSGTEMPLALMAASADSDAIALFAAVYSEGGGQLVSRTLGTDASVVIGALGDADELHGEVTDGVHAAFSRAQPLAGLVGWRGARQDVAHHPTPGGGTAWVVERESRRLRLAVVDGTRLSHRTLVPWGSINHPCGQNQGLIGSAFVARGEHRVASWWLGQVEGECEPRQYLHTTWLSPRGRPLESAQQPLPPEFPFGGLGTVVGDDGSVSVLRRSFVEDDHLSIGLFGFDPSGAPVAPRTTRIQASEFEPLPMVRCAESAWLPFLRRSTEEDGSLELWTLPVPLTGPFTSPRRRWKSPGTARCFDNSYVSACIGDEAAIAAKCLLEGEESARLLFRSWPAD